jgi:uncharacterized membrane protein
VNAASTELIQPNLHIALVHFPIALLAVGTFVEVFSFLGWRRSTLRTAGRWMILLGAVAGPAVAAAGLYAMYDVLSHGLEYPPATWAELVQTSPLVQQHAAAWGHLQRHLLLQLAGGGAALLTCFLWVAASDRWRANLQWSLAILLLASTTVTLAGAHVGGELVYQNAVGVTQAAAGPTQDPATSNPSHDASHASNTPPATQPTDADLAGRAIELSHKAAAAMPPRQIHATLGGLVIAVSVMGLALSIRRSSELSPIPEPQDRRIAAALAPVRDDLDVIASPWESDRAAPPVVVARPAPAAKIWLLSLLLAAAAAALGFWTLAHEADTYQPQKLWNLVSDSATAAKDAPPWLNRRMIHTAGGAVLLVTPLLGVLFAWLCPRARLPLLLLALLTLAGVATQAWLGTLLLLDGPAGELLRFMPAG